MTDPETMKATLRDLMQDIFERYPVTKRFAEEALCAGVSRDDLVSGMETGLALMHSGMSARELTMTRVRHMVDEDPLMTVAKSMICSADMYDMSRCAPAGLTIEQGVKMATRALLGMAMLVMAMAEEQRQG